MLKELLADPKFRQTDGGFKAISMLAKTTAGESPVPRVLELAEGLVKQDQELATILLEHIRGQVVGRAKYKDALAKIVSPAVQVLKDPEQPIEKRVAACRLVVMHPTTDEAMKSLLSVANSTQPQALQIGAIGSLRKLKSDQIAITLLQTYDRQTPKTQQAIVELLQIRGPWLEALLTAVVEKQVPRHVISAHQISMLRANRSERVRKLVETLNDELSSTPRAKIVQEWQDVLKLKGNAATGRDVFRKNCAKCHRLENFGEQLGPGLAAIRNRGIDAVLMNILDPNREVNPQYSSYSVVTDDGRTVSGMIASETASGLTLRDGEKVNVTIARDEIDEIRNTGLSLMPDGLEKQIGKQQMADLLHYLMTVNH